jgi:kanamycin kinase
VSDRVEPGTATVVEERISGTPAELDGLRHRLEWISGRVPAPRLLREERDGDDAVLVIEPLRGEPATAPEHRADAIRSVSAFAEALAAWHRLDAAECPFEIDVEGLVASISERARAGTLTVDDPVYAHVAPDRLAAILVEGSARFAVPSRPVVCNGHPTLGECRIDGTGAGFGRVDRSGVADVCLDLAIAARSVARDDAPSLVGTFFEAYGRATGHGQVELARLDWYQLLDALR